MLLLQGLALIHMIPDLSASACRRVNREKRGVIVYRAVSGLVCGLWPRTSYCCIPRAPLVLL